MYFLSYLKVCQQTTVKENFAKNRVILFSKVSLLNVNQESCCPQHTFERRDIEKVWLYLFDLVFLSSFFLQFCEYLYHRSSLKRKCKVRVLTKSWTMGGYRGMGRWDFAKLYLSAPPHSGVRPLRYRTIKNIILLKRSYNTYFRYCFIDFMSSKLCVAALILLLINSIFAGKCEAFNTLPFLFPICIVLLGIGTITAFIRLIIIPMCGEEIIIVINIGITVSCW